MFQLELSLKLEIHLPLLPLGLKTCTIMHGLIGLLKVAL